jgi:hypothetical protein
MDIRKPGEVRQNLNKENKSQKWNSFNEPASYFKVKIRIGYTPYLIQ